MFEKEAIIHAFEATIGIEYLNKPIEDFTYEELSDEQQEKAYDFKKGAEFGYNKANEELEEKISVLLSCKNCSENKGGWICAKEYENKCLAQKIEFIKELEKENTELKEKVSYLEDNLRVARKDRKNLQLEVGKGLKEFIKDCPYSALKLYANGYYAEQLTKAKEIIKDYMTIAKGSHSTVCGVPEENRTIYVLKLNKEAEQFLNSEVEE